MIIAKYIYKYSEVHSCTCYNDGEYNSKIQTEINDFLDGSYKIGNAYLRYCLNAFLLLLHIVLPLALILISHAKV